MAVLSSQLGITPVLITFHYLYFFKNIKVLLATCGLFDPERQWLSSLRV